MPVILAGFLLSGCNHNVPNNQMRSLMLSLHLPCGRAGRMVVRSLDCAPSQKGEPNPYNSMLTATGMSTSGRFVLKGQARGARANESRYKAEMCLMVKGFSCKTISC